MLRCFPGIQLALLVTGLLAAGPIAAHHYNLRFRATNQVFNNVVPDCGIGT
jgi:hypothetical protein